MKRLAAFACALGLALAATARSQDVTGRIDTSGDIEAQIRYLEQFVGGDLPAEKQAVMYRWLADLYTSVGRLDDAQRAHETILGHFPYDVGARNAYALFLLDHRDDPAAADSVLGDAVEAARTAPNTPVFLGQTHALHARALHELGRDEEALEAVDRALALMDADAAEDALRIRARALESLGRQAEAEEAFVQLIGLECGSNPDDVSALIALMTAQTGSVDAARVDARIEAAIVDARARRSERIRRDGAEVVVIPGEGGARLEGTLRRGKESGAILFVPDLGGRRASFAPYAQLFALDGLTTFAIDPRGHGDSRSDLLPSFAGMPQEQREKIPADIAAAYRHVRETLDVPAERIVVLAEGGASAVVEQTLQQRGIAAVVVHLSPVFDPQDRDILSALEFRAPRPTLLVASDEDAFAMRSVSLLTDSYPSPATEARIVSAAGHGLLVLREPKNFAIVANWIRATLGLPR